MATVTYPLKAKVQADSRASVEIYRPFFIAGILSVLTAGCLLGAVALLGIALKQSYTASAWTPYVLAHANSQLYGWVGFFIIGFALQQHPPTVRKREAFLTLAYWSLGLMGMGIGLRFAAEPLVNVNREIWLPIGVASCAMQTIAVALFIANIGLNRYKEGALTWQTKFVFASLGWLMLIAAVEPFFFALSHQADRKASVMFVAEFFAPYREAQFLGFVAMMIFGVALVKLNSCFGAKEARRDMGNLGFALWNGGLLLKMLGWLAYYREGFTDGSDMIMRAGILMLVLGAFALIIDTRVFEPLSTQLRSHKFIRAALGWLLISGVLMLLEPFHLRLIGEPFSHAYTGAIRHALTVGFISQMIIGFAAHVVVMMNDLDPQKQNRLWMTFWLLNVGNLLRIVTEIATDYTPAAFGLMGVTGFIELTGLALWAFNIMGIFAAKRLEFAR